MFNEHFLSCRSENELKFKHCKEKKKIVNIYNDLSLYTCFVTDKYK